MPLIVISGLPCSGKTTIAEKLKIYFQKNKNIKAKIISEESFYNAGDDRNSIYSDSNKEKELRSSMKSEVERHLSKDSILIFDSLNYVKGFRYELFCVSKSNSTTQCTIHCDVSLEDAKVVNGKRSAGGRYSDTVLEGLFMRYEVPINNNRWDSPLFHLPLNINNNNRDIININNKDINYNNNKDINNIINNNNDITNSTNPVQNSNEFNDNLKDIFGSGSDASNNTTAPTSTNNNSINKRLDADNDVRFEEIHDCLILKKSPKPHLSTVTAPVLPGNFLHQVDNISKTVVQEILEKQKNCVPGDMIKIESSSVQVEFIKYFSMAELQRIRRQYVAFSRTHPISNPSLIPTSFVHYVNSRSDL